MNMNNLANTVLTTPSAMKAKIARGVKRVVKREGTAKIQKPSVITIVLTNSPEIVLEPAKPLLVKIANIAPSDADDMANS
jgi:hypothetical protein